MTRKYNRRSHPPVPAKPILTPAPPEGDGPVTEVAPIVIAPAAPVLDMESIGHTPAVTERVDAAKPKLVAVKLLRNYRPMTDVYEIVGYEKEAVIRKRPDGKMVEVEAGGFFKETDEETGEIMPAPPTMPGTGFDNKLNVGTVVRLPREEAKRARDLKIGEYELDD